MKHKLRMIWRILRDRFDLVEKANDVENFKRVKAERIKDSQERFDLLYKKLITSTTHKLKTCGLVKAQVD